MQILTSGIVNPTATAIHQTVFFAVKFDFPGPNFTRNIIPVFVVARDIKTSAAVIAI